MAKFISFEILGATPIEHKHLYEQGIKLLADENESFQWANIYFFCRVNKRRFDLNCTKIVNFGMIKTTILVANKAHEVEASILRMVPAVEELTHADPKSFEFVMDYQKSSAFKLYISLRCKFFPGKEVGISLNVTNFEHLPDIDLQNPPEIVYIGQSFRILDRVQEHKTLGKIVSELEDYHEIIIYFINFQYMYGGMNPVDQMWGFMSNVDQNSSDYKQKIALAERFLIYYFKPQYNEQHINTELYKDNKVRSILMQSGIELVALSCAMNGAMYQFWSPRQALTTELVFYNFEAPQKGFYENEDLLEVWDR